MRMNPRLIVLPGCLIAMIAASAAAVTPLNVGSKRFTESYILGEIIKQAAQAAGETTAVHRQGLGNTAIVLNRIRLDAVVGGNEVSNPFVVTEVYVRQNDTWKLGSLSFTRLLGQ